MISNKDKPLWDWYTTDYLRRVITNKSILVSLTTYDTVGETGYLYYDAEDENNFILTDNVVTSELVNALFKGQDF